MDIFTLPVPKQNEQNETEGEHFSVLKNSPLHISINQSQTVAAAAFLSVSLSLSVQLIVWLLMSGRVGETSLRDCAALYMCLRERERERETWYCRPLPFRLLVAIVTGCCIA